MTTKQILTPEEISALANRIADEFDSIDWEEMEMARAMPQNERWLVSIQKTEMLRADLRNKLTKDFPELSIPEINMKILRSSTSVRIGKSYTEPAYHEYFG